MRKFDSPIKDCLYLGWRLVSPILDPIRLASGIKNYYTYIKGLKTFKGLDRNGHIKFIDLSPQLYDKTDYTPFDAHYFYQQLWAFEKS